MRRVHIAAAAVIFVCMVLALLAYWRVSTLLSPVASTGTHAEKEYFEKEVEIPLKYSTAQIAALLEEEGIIKSALLFRLYTRYRGYDQQLQAGRYTFSSGMSMEDILQELRRGVVYKETNRFTIPEGFTLEQIAARLGAAGLVDEDVFLEACRHYQNDEFTFLKGIPPEVYYNLEGYLFPDTYEVYPGATAEEIITVMLRRFNTVCNEEYRHRAEELGLTLHEVVTIASLVEKEGQVEEEKTLISAVFHNRLQNKHMPLLQSCATVHYALGETKAYLTSKDLEIDSPYNTYIYPYLPPGPIASPGANALAAAVNPAPVTYLYFVSKEDGSGLHYFSNTLQEHNRYKALAQRNRNE
ncbi:MAG: endolytic transglycosylase MltG [Bacillota bacterium]